MLQLLAAMVAAIVKATVYWTCRYYRTSVEVMSLDKDETHDIELSLDNDAGLLRLLITVSDTRLAARQSTPPRPSDHHTALVKYTVCSLTDYT